MRTIERAPVRDALLIHGAGGGGWEWNVWRHALGVAGWRTQAPDLMPTPAGIARTHLADYVDAMRACASSLTRPVLIGASLGGLVAAMVARDVDASALVLVNPVPPLGFAAAPTAPDARAVVPWGTARSWRGTVRAMPDADEPARLYAFRRWRDESGAVLREARAGVAVAPPACPVLVIASGRDDDVPVGASVALAHAWGATLVELPEASHVGPLLGRCAYDVALGAADWLAKSTLQLVTSATRS
jgi:pimeloyl-ACP methyl ester carboxylesterase